eukprot:TRINITY_DN17810_c0_g1_i3.p1 TRINITY_DN17810_c0_g1~~TRINITY_DN17810_c0_g1_i3.p1  ORF type:complete len:720 (-),score=73.52 TRINITY_DN17810_c0_g1_i3:375-2474(-)
MFGLLKKCCPSDFEGVDRIAEIDEVLPTSTIHNVQNNQERRSNQHGRHLSMPQLPKNVPLAQSPVTSTTSIKQNNYRREIQASFKRFELKQQQMQNGVSSSDKQPYRKIRHGYRVSDLEDLPKQEQQQSTDFQQNLLRKSYIGKGSSKLQIVWKKNQILGCGAFSTVFLGWSVTHDAPIAVKEIPARSCWNNLAKNDTQRILIQSSENEVNALRSLSHPNIVKYLGCERDQSDEVVRVFMEYVGNYTLLDLVRKQNFLDEVNVSAYIVQILQGLSYLHSQFIIHRDIKGSNILWSERDDVLKLADFGAATQLAQYLTSESGSGHLYGTPQYMSPEAMRGERVSFASDVWAVGCVVLEMLSGKSPWQRDFSNRFIAVNILSQKKSGPPIPENLSYQCKDFLNQCFRMNPRDRPTADQLLNHPFLICTQDVSFSQNAQTEEVCSELQDRSLSAPDITKVFEDSEIVYRTTYSSVVINQILQQDNDQKTEIVNEQQQCDIVDEYMVNNIYTSMMKMNPIRSYCSDEFCESTVNSVRTDYTHVEPTLFQPQRYLQHIESVEESIDSVSEIIHDEGQPLTTQIPEFRSSVASKSEGSMVLYGSVQCSPNVSPQVSRVNNRTPSTSLLGQAVNVSTDFSSAYSQIDENYPNQGRAGIQQLVDKEGRLPFQDAMQVLNKVEEITTKFNTVGNNTGVQEAVGKQPGR